MASTAPLFNQRIYQLVACCLFLFVLRLPPVKRWVAKKQKEGREAIICWALPPPIVLFFIGFACILHEEFLKESACSHRIPATNNTMTSPGPVGGSGHWARGAAPPHRAPGHYLPAATPATVGQVLTGVHGRDPVHAQIGRAPGSVERRAAAGPGARRGSAARVRPASRVRAGKRQHEVGRAGAAR